MTLDQLRYLPSLALSYIKLISDLKPDAILHTNWHHALLLLPFLSRDKELYWAHELGPVLS